MHQHEVDENEEALIHELFINCYICLKWQYNERQLKEGEDSVEHGQRIKEKHQVERKMQRKDTRQNKVRKISILRKIEFTCVGYSFMQIGLMTIMERERWTQSGIFCTKLPASYTARAWVPTKVVKRVQMCHTISG